MDLLTDAENQTPVPKHIPKRFCLLSPVLASPSTGKTKAGEGFFLNPFTTGQGLVTWVNRMAVALLGECDEKDFKGLCLFLEL